MNKYLLIIGGIIILATFVGWYMYIYQASTIPSNEETINFTQEGNLVKDNPGQEPGIWYLVYDRSGQPALSTQLQFDAQSQCHDGALNSSCDPSTFLQGMRAKVKGLQGDSRVLVYTLTLVQALPDTGMRITLYYYNPALDQGPGGAQCSKNGLVAVERTIPQTTTPLAEAIRLLLRGELSPQERAQGVTSEFPLAGVMLMSASIQDKVATLTFSDPQNKTGGGSCRVAILWAQIEATAKQFSTVMSVRFMPEELFQP